MNPLVKNAADIEQVKESGRKEKFNRERELDDLRFILSSQQGRRFYWRLLEKTGIFKVSFTGNPGWTEFNEGRREVGLWALGEMNEACPEAWLEILKERKTEDENA